METSLEWQPTPQVQLKLHALNNYLRHVRSQLRTNADNVASFTARYYKRKGAHVLEAIAPWQQSGLRSKLSKSTVIPLIQK